MKSLLLLVIIATGAFAEDKAPNPFSEGTKTVVLSVQEKENLLQYADNSKARLEKALKDARGLPFEQARDVYLAAIKKVVIDSYASKPRSELLMRYALNQALELTTGIPDAEGKGFVKSGTLAGSMNQDAQDLILVDSIKLALHYYQDDRLAIQSGTLLELPYVALAHDRLELGRFKWLPTIIEWRYQYDFSVTILKQWLATIANEEERHKVAFAEELTEANNWLEEELAKQSNSMTSADLKRYVRISRKRLRDLSERMKVKLPSLNLVVKHARLISDVSGVSSGGFNSLGMEFKAITAGTFLMGSPKSEYGRYGDERQHKVTIDRDFEIQTTEVTQKQWLKVMKRNPSRHKGGNRPVENASWVDAQDFIEKLNAQANDGYTYRLPTEAEWEYAARGGKTTAYFFGDDASEIDEYAWTEENSNSQTHNVKTRKPNGYGLYDMAGNVWEWVQDSYGNYPDRHMINPMRESVSSSRAVVRGGSYGFSVRYARLASRYSYYFFGRHDEFGFRLVRTRH